MDFHCHKQMNHQCEKYMTQVEVATNESFDEEKNMKNKMARLTQP